MASEYVSVDISNVPDLLTLAEIVRQTGQPRVLRRADEDIAVLMPVTPLPQRRRRSPTSADIEAAWSAFGAWKDEDVEAFLQHNAESRRLSTGMPVEL